MQGDAGSGGGGGNPIKTNFWQDKPGISGGIVTNCHFLKSVLLHVLGDAEYFWKKLFFDLKKISKFFEPLKKIGQNFFEHFSKNHAYYAFQMIIDTPGDY